MGKKYIVIIIIAAAIVLCAFGWNFYYAGIDAEGVPAPAVRVDERETEPYFAGIAVTKLGGLIEKELLCVWENGEWVEILSEADEKRAGYEEALTKKLGELGEAPYSLTVEFPNTAGEYPLNGEYSILICDENGAAQTAQTEGKLQGKGARDEFLIEKAGAYEIEISCRFADAEQGEFSAALSYKASFSVKNPDPVFTAGKTTLAQGDILSLKLENIPDGDAPVIESELGPAVFSKGLPQGLSGGAENEMPHIEGFSNWYAAVPIGNSRAPGDYAVTISAGELSYDTTVTVTKYDFDFQNLIIDTSVPSVAAAVSGKAIAEFREKISPLFETFSDELYWDGVFEAPVELGAGGFISTQFGEIRITNGNQSTRRSHYGMDFAVSAGTPVHAGGSGKVALAEFLLNTGNTVIIDHGGGLKSFYYHMESLSAEAGTLVAKGEEIGRVGSTGYSTGPHLHYEMRIGEQAVSPSMLFEPDAGLYSADAKAP